QGVLRDSGGKLQVNAVNVTIKLYAAQTGGEALATPVTSVSVKPVNGLFTVAIPVDATLAQVLANPPIWTELSVGNATYPRQLVTADVYALQCGTADALAPSAIDPWHELADSALQNGWIFYGANFARPGYYKDP